MVNMTPFILVHSLQRFEGTYCLYLHGRSVRSSKTSVIACHTPRSHTAEEHEIPDPKADLIIDKLKFRKTSVLAYTKALSYYVNSRTLQNGEKTGYGP
jgi:hypothetical protein